MSSCKSRTVITDVNGDLWDLGNPNIVGIQSTNGGTQTVLHGNAAQPLTISVPFVDAAAAFNAS